MNAHNQYPAQNEAANPKKGRIGRALGNLVSKGVASVAEQRTTPEAVGSVAFLDRLKSFMASTPNKRGVVTPDKRYESSLKTGTPITSREIQGGRMDLTHVIVAGNSVLGVVTKSEKSRDGYFGLKSASVIALPYGPHERHDGGSRRYSPTATLMEFDIANMRGRSVNGAVQEWQRERIGRTANPALGADEALSRNHLDMTVTADGALEVEDLNSSNGTYVLDGMSVGTMVGLQGEAHEHTLRMMGELAQNPFMWDPSLSGQRVIPQQ